MNPVADEMKDILMHYGMPRRSGRYPWGSGEDPYQRSRDFLGRIEELKKTGWSETPENIKKEFDMTTTQYRALKSNAVNERRRYNVETAKRLKEKEGLGATDIAKKMGVRESTVRSWLDSQSEHNMNKARETADFLKKMVDERGMIDVGAGTELELRVSKEKLKQALEILDSEGYITVSGGVSQLTNPGQQTTQKVLCPPGTPYKVNDKGKKVSSAIYDYEKVSSIKDYISRDGGDTYEKKFNYPESLDSKRLMIRYKEDGGIEKDGIIELRRNVPDLSLGESRYSQVRIMVDGTHYIKGMAVYSDNMPDGVDVIFNTNKGKGTPKMDVLKKIKDDPDNPFGSLIKDADKGGQYFYDSKTGERIPGSSDNPNKKLGLINKRADEGDWSEWKDALPSQFLSKQSLSLAKRQLGLAIDDKTAEFNEIKSLTNPTVKKHFLSKFADECDSAAVHLQAAALPGQKYHAIIALPTMKDTEVYAPNYENGTEVALIRYPHGGTFEIPILKVNNKIRAAKEVLGPDVRDAVCINGKVAERLSGADFDGDTVMVIPTNTSTKSGKVKIISTDPLKGLEGFDPKTAYGPHEVKKDADGVEHYYRNGIEYKPMKNKGTQMGVVSNLITDMTLQKADPDEIARAVRHSMVVIDAEKHHLDYKASEIENNIAALKKEYQTGGASTLISRSKGQQSVVKRQGTPKVNMKGSPWYDPSRPEGALIYKTADDATYEVQKVNKRTGEVTTVTKTRMQQSTKMAETDDAYTLVSKANTPMERAYADYANKMKAMANEARKELMTTGKITYSKAAKETYREEVSSLTAKLNNALLNAPINREVLRRANVEVKAKQEANPNMSGADLKKVRQQAVTKYRTELGAASRRERSIKITDREWEAIQAGAVSENTLTKILNNTDVDSLRERATPRKTTTLTNFKMSRIDSMRASGKTLNEIASALGVSPTTVSKYLKGVN